MSSRLGAQPAAGAPTMRRQAARCHPTAGCHALRQRLAAHLARRAGPPPPADAADGAGPSPSGSSAAAAPGWASSSALQAVAASVVLGAAGATWLPHDPSLPEAVQPLSSFLGYAYTAAWSISFYPQVLENQTKAGAASAVSLDFLVYSLLGFQAYALFTWALLFDSGAQAAYAAAHGGAAPDVCLADLLFAGHATVATALTLAQCWGAGGSSSSGGGAARRLLSPACTVVTSAVALASLALAAQAHAGCGPDGGLDCATWLTLLSWLGGVKVAMTLIKYLPQAWLNHTRRSTDGWAIDQVLLDVQGGVLSLAQQGLDAAARHDPGVLLGNAPKLAIAAISLAFDALFLAQHYHLYQPEGEGQQQQQQGAGQRRPQQQAAPVGGLAPRRR